MQLSFSRDPRLQGNFSGSAQPIADCSNFQQVSKGLHHCRHSPHNPAQLSKLVLITLSRLPLVWAGTDVGGQPTSRGGAKTKEETLGTATKEEEGDAPLQQQVHEIESSQLARYCGLWGQLWTLEASASWGNVRLESLTNPTVLTVGQRPS